jgi:hypothetical protein
MSLKNSLIVGAVVALLLLGVFGGWQLRKTLHPDLVVTHDTTYLTDDTWHHKYDSLSAVPPKEVWKWHPRDTIRIPGDTIRLPVDSTIIKTMLKDYLATYEFGHEFHTDTLDANIGVIVKRNHPISYSLDYKIKIPFQSIINTPQSITNYSSYLQGGIEMPLQVSNFNTFKLEATAVFPKWYGGAGWQPLTNTWSARAGLTIFKIKQRK